MDDLTPLDSEERLKTPFLGLNYWQGYDKPKAQDWAGDNELIDTFAKSTQEQLNLIDIDLLNSLGTQILFTKKVEDRIVFTNEMPSESGVILPAEWIGVETEQWRDLFMVTAGDDVAALPMKFIPGNRFSAAFWLVSEVERNGVWIRIQIVDARDDTLVASAETQIDLPGDGTTPTLAALEGAYLVLRELPLTKVKTVISVNPGQSFGVQIGVITTPPNEVSYINTVSTAGKPRLTSYGEMTDKPSINGVTVEGMVSLEDIGAQPAGDYLTPSDISTSYTDLTDKPSINNVTLNGNVTLAAIGAQPTGNYLTASDISKSYADLTNKPSINSVTLNGNVTLDAIGAQAKGNYLAITGGTMTGLLYAQSNTNATAQTRNIQISTSDLTAGSSSLTNGNVYLVYE